jgi:hypothetical protein
MLEIELDIFSGMPNPTWILSRAREARLYELLRTEPDQVSPFATSSKRLGLGYRGLIVRRIKTDASVWDKAMSARHRPFPNEFRVGIKAARKDSAADWLVKTASRQGVRLADEVQAVVARGVAFVPRLRGPVTLAPKSIANISRKQKSLSMFPTNSGRIYTRHGGRVVPTISTQTHGGSTTPPMLRTTIATASLAVTGRISAMRCPGGAGDAPPRR